MRRLSRPQPHVVQFECERCDGRDGPMGKNYLNTTLPDRASILDYFILMIDHYHWHRQIAQCVGNRSNPMKTRQKVLRVAISWAKDESRRWLAMKVDWWRKSTENEIRETLNHYFDHFDFNNVNLSGWWIVDCRWYRVNSVGVTCIDAIIIGDW